MKLIQMLVSAIVGGIKMLVIGVASIICFSYFIGRALNGDGSSIFLVVGLSLIFLIALIKGSRRKK